MSTHECVLGRHEYRSFVCVCVCDMHVCMCLVITLSSVA